MAARSPKKALLVNIALQLIALAVAGYLIHHHYAFLSGEAGFHSFCTISQKIDCDVVNTSRYSEFLGIPLATLTFGYSLLAILLSIFAIGDLYARREALLLLLGFSGFSVAISLYLLGVQLFELKTICFVCVALYAIDFFTLIATWIAWKRSDFRKNFFGEWKIANRKRLAIYLATGAAFILVAHALTSRLSTEVPLEKESFLLEFRAQPVKTIDPGNSARMGLQVSNPPVQVVEFADFQCPHCAMAAKQIHLILRHYANRMQLVYKSYPLDQACNPKIKARMHEYACLAAKASICANRFGVFEKYFEKIFENQSLIGPESLRVWAAELGVKLPDFDRCVASAETAEEVRRDIELADSLGLVATPTFFVNGRKVEGVLDERRMRLILNELGL
ncbi:MAG: thioredoxin domain-containing protein [Deltaproteobacteria bacterium]|nr:thioredoxin domain-containing protein [Deltaproteobacteria bacterium]